MKTIAEINEIAPYHPCEWQQGYGIWQHGYMEGQKSGVMEQKAIDDAEIVRLKAAWEQEAEINHDAEMAYKQGRHDAIDKACEWLEKHSEFWVYDDGFDCVKDMIDNFRKAMEE